MSIAVDTAASLVGATVPTSVSLFTVPLYIQVVIRERYGILARIAMVTGRE
jgi:hypothetical protein